MNTHAKQWYSVGANVCVAEMGGVHVSPKHRPPRLESISTTDDCRALKGGKISPNERMQTPKRRCQCSTEGGIRRTSNTLLG